MNGSWFLALGIGSLIFGSGLALLCHLALSGAPVV